MLTTSVVGRGIPMRQIAPLERRIRCLPAVLPRPTTEAPAGPARRARRASPRSTPPVCGLLFCHAGHRLMATAALVHRGKRNAAPCRSGLRAEPPRLTAIGASAWWFRARLAVRLLLSLRRGEACRRARGSLEGRSDLQRSWCPRSRTDLQSALARRAGPSRFRVVRFAFRAAPHCFIACRRRPAGRPAGEPGGDDALGETALMASRS